LPQRHPRRRHFQVTISGCLRGAGGASPAGTPTMIGPMAVIPAGIFNSAFHSGVLSAETAKPTTQRRLSRLSLGLDAV